VSEEAKTRRVRVSLAIWISRPGWIFAVGSALFCLSRALELAQLPADSKVGIHHLFFPGPTSLCMLAWVAAHLWIFVVALGLLRIVGAQGGTPRTRDWVLLILLALGAIVGRYLLARLASHGVSVVVPGIV